MQDNPAPLDGKVALVTGAARRVGAATVRLLHAHGMNIVLHYRASRDDAQAVQQELNGKRKNSVVLIQADLMHTNKIASMLKEATHAWGHIDVVINNASSFFPTPLGSVDDEEWDYLLGSNLKAPFFICQAAAGQLKKRRGSIVNIVDIHADRPLKDYPVYSIAKAGLVMLTKSLAREFGPDVRVNAVAPGAIMWPDDMDDVAKQRIISRVVLKRRGEPEDVARAILFLIRDANYVTGQVITVDGGRTLIN